MCRRGREFGDSCVFKLTDSALEWPRAEGSGLRLHKTLHIGSYGVHTFYRVGPRIQALGLGVAGCST